MNFFVWFTLFDVMLPSCISWWNSSKSVKKNDYKCLIALKAPVQIQVNLRQRFRCRRFFTTLCLRDIQDVKRRIRGELETMARQVLF